MSYIFDTFTNFLSGLGVPGRDKMTGHRYIKQVWTRDQLEASYQSDWIARKAITIPAHDATREWRAWQAKQDQIELLEETEDRLRLQLKLQEALSKARLYGGCCLLLGVDGDMASELDPTTIKKDGLKFIHVLAPHQIAVEDLERDISSPYYGQPKFYTLNDESGKLGAVKIHPSRMVRLIGLDAPDPMSNSGWGDPLLQVIHDAVASAGTVMGSVAAMISEAKFDVVKIPGLTEIFSTSDGTNRLIKRFSEANVAKSVINAVVLDGEEEWQRIGVDFNGMPEVMQMYLQVAAGACDIPVTRFLGMSPAGLNATGESDLANYYDRIKSDQELRLKPALEKLDIAIQRSALGQFDKNIFYEWNSLWQMDESTKADIAFKKAQATQIDADTGLIPFEALVRGKVNQLIEDGTYPGLEAGIDEAIATMEALPEGELPPIPGVPQLQLAAPSGPSGKGPKGMEGQTEKKAKEPATADSLARFLIDALGKWEEEKHPRVQGGKEAGRFGSGTGTSKAERAQRALHALAEEHGLAATLSKIKSVKGMKGKGVVPATSEKSGEHPGKGYSSDAYLDKNGVIHTTNVYDAQRALFDDRRVDLNQPKMVSTLIKRLGETALEMAEGGSTAPTFNLCNVTIKGTNLFCADQIGIPRVEMPVIKASKTAEFVKYLEDAGYGVKEGREKAANLRATQSEISGEKVAASMKRIDEEGKFYKRLVISNDDYILDGHHTWAGQLAHDAADNDLENDGRQVKVARIDIGIIDLIKEAEKWTGGKGKKAASEKAKGLDAVSEDVVADLEDLLRVLRDRTEFVLIDKKEWDESKATRVPEGEGGGGRFGTVGIPKVWQNARAIAALMHPAEKEPEAPKVKLEPEAINVGGDEWNKQTAIRLETEYQEAKPKLEALITSYDEGNSAEPPDDYDEHENDDEEEDQPYVPESWEEMSQEMQDDAEQQYFSSALSDYIQSEESNWYESGGAVDEAKGILAGKDAFLEDTLNEYFEEHREEQHPFDQKQLLNAMSLEYESNGEGTGDLTVNFDDDKLTQPAGFDPNQMTLPGVEPLKPHELLTEDMRDEITKYVKKAFDAQADADSGSVEVPDYLKESAEEYMKDNWSSNMSDEEKFEYVKNHTSILEDLEKEIEQTGGNPDEPTGLPGKWDPLNTTSGTDYQRTQRIAKTISLERAAEVIAERKIAIDPDVDLAKELRRVDSKLWVAWKESSTSREGQLLQVATADELGGRLNPRTGRGGKVELNKQSLREDADLTYSKIGGYAGVLAYLRGKWETTQILLDKAGMHELKLYRGIALDDDKLKEANENSVKEAGHIKAPTIKVVRNGAASTTFNPDIANGWSNDGNRVVLRALVPRTAAVSIPAYGINVKSEQEVVVAGTAWKDWDAWIKRAPRFESAPMKRRAA
jgi:phage-related protein (TIGR01555 family)